MSAPAAAMSDRSRRAYALLQEGLWDDAVDAFSAWIAEEGASAEASYGRARALFQLKRWSEAVPDFRQARELAPENLDASVGLAMSLAITNEFYEAIDVFEELLAAHPDYTRAHLQLGLLYYRMGMIPKGHEQMELALKSRPTAAEREQILTAMAGQKALDKRRYYKPDFEALRKENAASDDGWIKRILRLFKKKS
ncbi:MAG: tetratricopeptide repeat protein [Polyangiaceae bacterium]